jgi:hypothetical protein
MDNALTRKRRVKILLLSTLSIMLVVFLYSLRPVIVIDLGYNVWDVDRITFQELSSALNAHKFANKFIVRWHEPRYLEGKFIREMIYIRQTGTLEYKDYSDDPPKTSISCKRVSDGDIHIVASKQGTIQHILDRDEPGCGSKCDCRTTHDEYK